MYRHKYQQLLTDLGFTQKQALVYLTLLGLGRSLPSSIARHSGLKRSTVYVILEQLKNKALVSHNRSKAATYFTAVDPHLLLDDQKQRYKRLEKALPDLRSLRVQHAIKPQMEVFEGINGIIQIMEDSLTTKGEIYCWSAGEVAYECKEFREYHANYVKNKNRRGIWVRGLFQYDEVGLALKRKGAKEKREIYLIPSSRFPFDNEINIYDDKMSIISHKDKVGVIMQNEAIASAQRSIFKFAFEYAKILEPQILSEEHKKEFNYS